MPIIESAGLTDVGLKRKGNEDSYFVDDRIRLYVVADGMGGHKAGEVASRLVVETLHDYLKRFDGSGSVEELDDPDPALSKSTNRLLSGIHLANKVVYQLAQQNPAYKGMGATVSAIFFADGRMIAANVGDSPIYLIRNGGIHLQSEMHTFMAEQEAIAPGAARKLGESYRHMLTRAMGTKPQVEPFAKEVQPLAGDRIVISSDGLTDMVKPEEILHVVTRVKPQKACRFLVDLANKRGGNDNITVIVLEVREASSSAPPPPASTPESSIMADFDTDESSYRGAVRALSMERVVIETSEPLSIDQEVMVNLTRSSGATLLNASGRITARSSDAITVHFEPPLSAEQKKSLTRR
jgi:serine/threonine protein phosphatase PrpC